MVFCSKLCHSIHANLCVQCMTSLADCKLLVSLSGSHYLLLPLFCEFSLGLVSVSPLAECAELGSSVTFTCTATAVPSQNFTWIRLKTTERIADGNQYSIISSTGSSQLTIINVSAADHGYYACVATMNPEQPNKAVFHLKVPCKSTYWFYYDHFLKGSLHQLLVFAIHFTCMYLMDFYHLIFFS